MNRLKLIKRRNFLIMLISALVVVLLSVSYIYAEWTAYNDCGDGENTDWDSDDPNVTNFGALDSPWGNLKRYSDGSDSGVSISYSGNLNEGYGAEHDGGSGRTPPVYSPSGTDAYNEFGTKINVAGISYCTTGNSMTVSFLGVLSSKKYTLVVLGMRGQYNNRWSSYTITGVSSYENNSSTGIPSSDRIGNTTVYCAGDNYDNGYVAKWTNVVPESTSITLTIKGVAHGADSADKGYISAIKLVERLLDETRISNYTSGTPTVPPTTVDKGTTGNCLGTFRFDGAGTVSQITITEYGTCDAANDLENIKLFQDDGDGDWESGIDTTQLGSTTTFSGPSSTATFSGFSLVACSTCYVHVVLDVKDTAPIKETIGVEISTSTDVTSTKDVTAPSWPVQLRTALIGPFITVSNYTEGYPIVPPSKVYRGTTKNCLGTFKFDGSGTISEITITEYGTCNANGDLENVKLFQDNGDGNWESGDDTTQLGSTTTFSASSSTATFSGLNLTAGATCYVHIVLDVLSDATTGQTVGIELYQDDIVCTSTATASSWPVKLSTSTIILQQVTASKYTGGSPSVPPGTVYKESTENCLGTFRFDGLGTISQITITEYGTCDAPNDLENIKLFQDDGDGNWESGDDTTQLGSTTNFNSSNEATFPSLDITASATCYVHVVLDVNSNATDDETVGIELYQDDIVCTTPTTASGWPVQLGTSNIATYTAEATVAFICDARPRLFGDGESQLTDDLNQINDQMGSGWTLDAVVTTGDMDYISEAGQQTLDDAYAVSDVSTTPLFYAVGNHEIDNSYDMPVLRNKFSGYSFNPNSGPANCEETTYSYDVGDIHVAVINEYYNGTSDTGTNGDVVNALFDWLKNDLRTTTKPYKVVAAHEPAYPEAWQRHVGDSLDGYPDNRDRFWNLLKTERALAYFCGHTHVHKFQEYDGVFECDAGVCGGMVGGSGYDDFATIFYAHFDEADGFQIRAVKDLSWAAPTVVTKTRADLETQVMVNTAERAGTRCSYFIDYTAADESNPDWSGNNSSKWWESAFSTTTASWSSGELCVGYDTTLAWPWMNTEIDNKNGVYGVFIQVPFTCYDKSSYNSMELQVDYDDAVTVWLNGTQIYKTANSPDVGANDIWDKTASSAHTADGDADKNPDYTNGTFDVTNYMSSLNEGSNFLAIGNWNSATTSSDLAAGIKLYLTTEITTTIASEYHSGTPAVPPSYIYTQSTGNCLGTFKFDGVGAISNITITAYGTCDAPNDLENVKLFQDDGDGNWEPLEDTTQIGSTTTFSGASSTATFSGFSLVACSTCYIHVVLDVKSIASHNDTIGIQISQSSDVTSTKNVIASSWPVQLGASTIRDVSSPEVIAKPREPCGIKGRFLSSKVFEVSWSKVTKDIRGEKENLEGYDVYRATSTEGTWARINSVGNNVFSSTDIVNGEIYYYRINAVDIDGNESRGSMIVDTTVNIIAVAEDDPRNQIKMSKEINSILYKSNVYDEDINIILERDDNEERDGDTITCYDIRAVKADSGKEIQGFKFNGGRAEISLYYEVNDGKIGDDIPASEAANRLAIYWFNGIEWIKLGGEVDKDRQIVTVRTRHLSKFAIKKTFNLAGFRVTSVWPKIFTPYGGGIHKTVKIYFEGADPDEVVVGKIFDITGALVYDSLSRGDDENSLVWDGRFRNGRMARSGIYIYQVESRGKVINGTIVLAK